MVWGVFQGIRAQLGFVNPVVQAGANAGRMGKIIAKISPVVQPIAEATKIVAHGIMHTGNYFYKPFHFMAAKWNKMNGFEGMKIFHKAREAQIEKMGLGESIAGATFTLLDAWGIYSTADMIVAKGRNYFSPDPYEKYGFTNSSFVTPQNFKKWVGQDIEMAANVLNLCSEMDLEACGKFGLNDLRSLRVVNPAAADAIVLKCLSQSTRFCRETALGGVLDILNQSPNQAFGLVSKCLNELTEQCFIIVREVKPLFNPGLQMALIEECNKIKTIGCRQINPG